MDRTRGAADGARGISRRGRAWNPVVAALVVQNLLVASSLLLSLHVYCCFQGGVNVPSPNTNVHIQFLPMKSSSFNKTLEFLGVTSQYKMSVVGRDRISINCTGPYLLHMHVCHKSMVNRVSEGTLALRLAEDGAAPLASFSVNATSSEACMRLHGIIYLRQSEQVVLSLYVFDDFKMVNLTVGLNLLLPGECGV